MEPRSTRDDARVADAERFAREIRRKLPVDPVEKLEGKLQRAIKREDYEQAAKLRDEIQVRKAQREGSGA